MTKARHPAAEHRERGSALIGVLLLLMMMSALAAALSVSGQTETLISRNQQSGAQAHAAAEAGLNHAIELTMASLGGGSTTNDLLAQGDLGLGAPQTITPGIKATYAVLVQDDAGGPGEDGNALNDANGTVIVQATGKAQDETEVVLEAVISNGSLTDALVVCGDVTIGGSANITGAQGGVSATGTATVTGSASVDGPVTSGAAITCPAVQASDYRHFADFILKANGTMTDQAGTPLPCCNSWSFDSATGTWSLNSNSASGPGTYYIEGKVIIGGSPGSAKSPFLLTLIAEGSINIVGHPNIMPDTPELLFVTNGDLKIAGAIDTGNPLTAGGQMLVHEQIDLQGNPFLLGQVIVENASNDDPLVSVNDIRGSVEIMYNGGLGGGGGAVVNVSGWREVR